MEVIAIAFFASVAIFSIVIALLLMLFVMPTIKSPGHLFIKAKKRKAPVVFLDNGSHWIGAVGQGPVKEGFIRDDYGNVITVSPNSLKYCQGVMIGVGENHRSMIVNPAIVSLIKLCKDNKLTSPEVDRIVKEIEKRINKEEENVQEKEETGTDTTAA